LVTAFGELATVGLAVERAVQLPPLTVEPPRIATP
jgi:hypothetical protein